MTAAAQVGGRAAAFELTLLVWKSSFNAFRREQIEVKTGIIIIIIAIRSVTDYITITGTITSS